MPEIASTRRGPSAPFGTLGAMYDGDATAFRVWAPDHETIELVLNRSDVRPLSREHGGYWYGRYHDVKPGARYCYRIDRNPSRTFPDPASRFQPEGVHGPSEIIDASCFRWTDAAWHAPALDRLVFYELHVGTFTPEGTFAAAIERLPYLADLGVTAIELMPVADFPGDRNWGYDGVALFAPARCYGRPDGLRALVDAAHRHGLGVFLDVVYNHFGPDGAYANVFSSHYFTESHRSPWGMGVNLDDVHSAEVRRFFIENAIYWVNDFHVDGLRVDATHALKDDSSPHFLAELSSTVRAHAARPVILIAEDHRNLEALAVPQASGGLGFDAVWADDFHHQARVHTARDRDGYYADFSGSIQDLAVTLRGGWFFRGQRSAYLGHERGTDPAALLPRQFVICIQNHDQIGNRADGARLHHQIDLAAYRALSVLLLLAPQTPLLFMGQEWAASTPFLFFTDHHEELGKLVTAGRRNEFSRFAAFTDPSRRAGIPDPQSLDTFERSRLRWDEATTTPHAGVAQLYRRALAIRRGHPAWHERSRDSYRVDALDEHTLALEFTNDPWLIVARLSGGRGTVHLSVTHASDAALTTEDPGIADDGMGMMVTTDRRKGSAIVSVAFQRPGAVVFPSRLT